MTTQLDWLYRGDAVYRQPFGRFEGMLLGGIQLAEGYGVMEFHVVDDDDKSKADSPPVDRCGGGGRVRGAAGCLGDPGAGCTRRTAIQRRNR
jgi:hypothetical protein